jgi:hypothetical protein
MHGTYTPRNIYGETKIYPVNVAAKAIANIAGTKTLRKADMLTAQKDLGMTWEQVSDPTSATVGGFLTL